jgi:hypothetical protein
MTCCNVLASASFDAKSSTESFWKGWVTGEDDFVMVRLRDIQGITVTYGVVDPERFTPGGIPMLQAKNIVGGRLLPDSDMHIHKDIDQRNRRTRLREGDLALVLVGRVGAAAMVTAEHVGWNAARSVGIIRCEGPSAQTEGLVEWLRYWFMAPSMREWFAAEASSFAQPTLSVQSLADLVIPLPSVVERRRFLDRFAFIEERASASLDLARTALEMTDALFLRLRADAAITPMTLGDVCEARAAGRQRDRGVSLGGPGRSEDGQSGVEVSTADVLNAEFPYRCGRGPGSPEPVWTLPSQLLIATKKESAGIVLDVAGDAVAARGTLSVCTQDVRDQWWLLHELRSRPADLVSAALGTSARELSARKFGRLAVSWPTMAARSEFGEVASALHERAFLAREDHQDSTALLGLLIERAVAGMSP